MMECSDFVKTSLNYLKSVVHSTTHTEYETLIEPQNSLVARAFKPATNVSKIEKNLLVLIDLTTADPLDVLIKSNGFKALERIITVSDDECSIINSINTISNIALRSNTYRDSILKHDVIQVLVRKIGKIESIPVLKSFSRALLIICCEYDENLPRLSKINIVGALTKLLLLNDEDTNLTACLVMTCICNSEVYEFEDRRKVVFDKEVCNRLIELLEDDNHKAIRSAALLCIAALASLNLEQSGLMISCGCLNCFSDVIENEKLDLYMKKSICLFMKNICSTTADDSYLLQKVFDSSLLPYVINIVGDPFGADLVNRRMISAALNFASSKSSSEQIKYLVDQNCIEAVLRNLKVDDDEEFLIHAVGMLKTILDHGNLNEIMEYENIFQEYLGLLKFQNILDHPHASESVKELAGSIKGVSRKRKTSKISLFSSIASMASRFSLSKSKK